jgi:hypothetical protein
MTHKKVKKFYVLKCWMLSFEGLEAFPVAWTSFVEAFGTNVVKFLMKKIRFCFQPVKLYNFLSLT